MKLAQDIHFGPLEIVASPRFAGGDLSKVVSVLILYLFPIAGLLLLLYLLYGGYRYLLSGGSPKAIAEARSIITSALIGFVIVFVAFWIVQIVGMVLGIDVFSQLFP